MSDLLRSLLDPGTFAARYGARGFLAILTFCAVTEAAWKSL